MTAVPSTVRIATRSSPMAMAQAEQVGKLLAEFGVAVEFVPLTTSGDRWTGDLAVLGGKGAFVKEIDRALLDGEADIAVHCLKDIPGDEPLPPGLTLCAYLPREEVADCVVGPVDKPLPESLAAMPEGLRIGTSSVRRRAQLLRICPQATILPVRGNANTRLAKLDRGEFDTLILARAGLRRIGQSTRIGFDIPVREMLPAVGAGQLVLEAQAARDDIMALAARLDDPLSSATARAERAMLAGLDGNCHSPIAGYAVASAGAELTLHGVVYSPDGSEAAEAVATGTLSAPEELGRNVAAQLVEAGARALIDAAS